MFHFFPKFADDVEAMPFASELRRNGVPYRMFADAVDRQYKTRAGLMLRVYPALLWSATRLAIRSLVRSQPRPDAVIITSDIEALVFGLLIAILRRKTRVVFETLIATPREGLMGRLHHAYYAFVLRFVDVAVVHSEVEATAYAALFPRAATRFVCLPYSISVVIRDELRALYAAEAADSNVIVAAGRSGRDYATLGQAVLGQECTLHVICDYERPTRELPQSDQIEVLRACFGRDYLVELARARFVVVPISVQGISAGQMVLLQAFALGKAVILTDTTTTREYAEDGHDALFVAFGSAEDMRQKIALLLADPALCRRLGDNAARRFEQDFSTEAYARKMAVMLAGLAGG